MIMNNIIKFKMSKKTKSKKKITKRENKIIKITITVIVIVQIIKTNINTKIKEIKLTKKISKN